MKKLVIGLAAIGAVLAMRQLMKGKAAQKMGEHCNEMAAKCKEKMAQFQAGHEAPMPECSEPTVVAHGDRSEALSTA
jgi:hypothetical protein